MTAWLSRAVCVGHDPDLFFPVGDGPDARAQAADARRICVRCPVRDACLQWAHDQGPSLDGIWGGTDQRQRKNRRRILARAAAAGLPEPERRSSSGIRVRSRATTTQNGAR